MARIGREFEEMWKEASKEAKEVFTKAARDRILKETDAHASDTYPTLTPVIRAITDALTSGDPEFRYIVDGSNKWIDTYCVCGLFYLVTLEVD